MQKPATGAEAEQLLRRLRALVQGIRATSYAVERACGITGAQLFVLRELSLEPGASIRSLSKRTLTDPSSVSVVVARLVSRDLVVRGVDATDRRKTALAITEKGEQLLARAPEPYQGQLIAALRGLPRAERVVLDAALGKLTDALGLTSDNAPLFFEDSKPRKERASRDPK